MQARVGSTLSDQFEQAQGVPQGSILYHPIQYQNKQHCKLYRSEDRGFIIC